MQTKKSERKKNEVDKILLRMRKYENKKGWKEKYNVNGLQFSAA